MNKEVNSGEVKKLVLLVEDKLPPLLNILLSIQQILFVSNKQGLENAPKDKDTQIKVLHLIDCEKDKDPEHFERFKRTLEAREQDESNVSKLEYQYQPLAWDTQGYPEDCERCADSIAQQIQQICEGKDYSIILDAILLEPGDEEELANPKYGGRVLSQCLFEYFRDHCIPYTNYGQGTKHIRDAWAKGVSLDYEMFQRQQIVGNAIYKPFRNKLYSQLRIGEDTP